MGWRFRKSINLGFGFRVNLSKSGIGYSWGFPGYRKTWKANGGTRTTYSFPGTGISYVEDSGSDDNENSNANSNAYPVINGKIDALSTPENEMFVKKIKSIKVKSFITWLIGVSIICIWLFLKNIIPNFIWIPIIPALCFVVFCLCYFINSRRVICLEYNIDQDISSIIAKREHALSHLFECEKIGNIEEYEKVNYTRVNAGAGTNIKLGKVSYRYAKPPKYLKVDSNFKVYQLNIGATTYIFLPDKILVVGFFAVGALKYNDITVTLADSKYVETEPIPKDSTVLYNTWQYVNNNGTPDRRFKNNCQLPVLAYEKIYLNSKTGLNLHLMVSSRQKAVMFKDEWDNLNDIL